MTIKDTLKSSDQGARRQIGRSTGKAASKANGASNLSTRSEYDVAASFAARAKGTDGVTNVPVSSAATAIETRVEILERRLQLLSAEFQTALTLLSPSAADEAAAPASGFGANVSFDADSLSPFAIGFYPREYSESGTPFRWTGSGPLCEVRLFLDRTEDREFAIDVGDTDGAILAALGGYVDYAPVALTIESGPTGHLVTGLLPKRAYTRLAVITIALGKAPASSDGSDEAWLGFRFYSMHVRASDASER